MLQKPQSLTGRAYQLLSRREYSRQELARTLSDHAESHEELQALLDQLQRDGYQSDERFTEIFIRSRVSRGHGPVRIVNDLKQRGVDANLIQVQLAEADVDWFALALQQRQKRFGLFELVSIKDKAKCQRFLLYRGFNHEQTRYAIEAVEAG